MKHEHFLDLQRLDSVKEGRFRLAAAPWLRKWIASNYGIPLPNGVNAELADCIYTEYEGNRTVVSFCAFEDMPDEPDTACCHDFVEYLLTHQPASYADLLFLTRMYHYRDFVTCVGGESEHISSQAGHRQRGTLRSPTGRIIEDMLRDSRGHILWHFQLEGIFNLFIPLQCRCKDLRMGIGRKDPTAFATMKSIQIESNLTLYDLVVSRMLKLSNGEMLYTYPADFRGARVLYELLVTTGQRGRA